MCCTIFFGWQVYGGVCEIAAELKKTYLMTERHSHFSRTDFYVGGLPTYIHGLAEVSQSRLPISVLFLLHGRQGSSNDLTPFVQALLESAAAVQDPKMDLLVVTFDHRNHGHRKVQDLANGSWSSGNQLHAQDMLSIQYGTATDVSLLVDFLPSYLFPNDQRKIELWGCAGVSLGGHSTWMVLRHEPRISIGIPIIGCPDYIALMSHRARKASLGFCSPHLPKSLIKTIKRLNAASNEGLESMSDKKILVLSGKDDQIVPWPCSETFVSKLPDVHKKIVLYEGVGHELTHLMINETCKWIDCFLVQGEHLTERL
ncbi:hypothetical protein NEOLI_003512 [Neolecta irregularis DAH-3]|uniref:Peptidase S9 prolyl oligopeptidase catalytic domain-containing protein n=1 Tax=Neolecta irregularis (strain DAH-3) TaxID=1198029 RepID=A0A1U7LUD1_NEOID|nr:hypothetical protein NEOLI_003512 [Neolecta irregularis DAH-3]|eukprot:OLL26285.1 hypothetical protein NEOLI_003512 [Neolecta irregularis DAH-3]